MCVLNLVINVHCWTVVVAAGLTDMCGGLFELCAVTQSVYCMLQLQGILRFFFYY